MKPSMGVLGDTWDMSKPTIGMFLIENMDRRLTSMPGLSSAL